ncbi:CmpA/NrtA family ABC transporter substrate-binding protein [Magnetococcus sp. PR-3]|uniref:CmpA/NrtA family ABC transporter substrate-binding protein n=1 Tax=Magnetococcus sp. PR-3 TaxID=3120355 RepID=UPI002FCE2E90
MSPHPTLPSKRTPIRVGFVPLLDCASLIVAQEKGFAHAHGVDLKLEKVGAWAAIRDKIACGSLDCAHMLAGMTLALHMGLQSISTPMLAPMSLGQGGNAITLAPWLMRAMQVADPKAMAGPPAWRNQALAKVIHTRKQLGEPPLKFAVVYPFSSHNYELRYWLAAAGIDPDEDVEIRVTPPPRMVKSLRSDGISGFCVGEPWNQLAVDEGLGQICVTKQDIWPASPEKVLGLRQSWGEQNPEALNGLMAALVEAGIWADDLNNRDELVELLAAPDVIGIEPTIIAASLAGDPAPILFQRHLAQFPWISQAQWLLEQMQRWGQLPEHVNTTEIAQNVYQPERYNQILDAQNLPYPQSATKQEGQHDSPYTIPASDGRLITLPPDQLFDQVSI